MTGFRSRVSEARDAGRWRSAARYLAISAVLYFEWGIAHLRFYTIWSAPPSERAFVVVHCTGGDVLIAAAALALAVVLAGRDWPRTHAARLRVALVAIILGVGYTIFSEWLNVEVRQSWTYAPSMPLLPQLGTGFTPVLQWLALPWIALILATWPLRRSEDERRR